MGVRTFILSLLHHWVITFKDNQEFHQDCVFQRIAGSIVNWQIKSSMIEETQLDNVIKILELLFSYDSSDVPVKKIIAEISKLLENMKILNSYLLCFQDDESLDVLFRYCVAQVIYLQKYGKYGTSFIEKMMLIMPYKVKKEANNFIQLNSIYSIELCTWVLIGDGCFPRISHTGNHIPDPITYWDDNIDDDI